MLIINELKIFFKDAWLKKGVFFLISHGPRGGERGIQSSDLHNRAHKKLD